MGLGNATLSDEQIKGTLRVGQVVQAKHPDRKELVEATITKIQDCSQYTVGELKLFKEIITTVFSSLYSKPLSSKTCFRCNFRFIVLHQINNLGKKRS